MLTLLDNKYKEFILATLEDVKCTDQPQLVSQYSDHLQWVLDYLTDKPIPYYMIGMIKHDIFAILHHFIKSGQYRAIKADDAFMKLAHFHVLQEFIHLYGNDSGPSMMACSKDAAERKNFLFNTLKNGYLL